MVEVRVVQEAIASITSHNASLGTVVGMSGTTVITHPATLYERDYDTCSGFDGLHVLPDFFDNPREFMAENSWEPGLPTHPAPVSLP
jgi:hypothetical protein